MKKGFTLIELLAVIVILAIIALIATPIILNIINDARDSANERSAELYITAVEQAYATRNLKEEFNPTQCTMENGIVTCEGYNEPLLVEVNGQKPTSGTIVFENGSVKSGTTLNFSGFAAKVGDDDKITIEQTTVSTPTSSIRCILQDGTHQEIGSKYSCKVNNNTSYMFYIIGFYSDNTVGLITEKNICENGTESIDCKIEWISKGDYITAGGEEQNYEYHGNSYGPITLTKYFNNATQTWDETLNKRLPSQSDSGVTVIGSYWTSSPNVSYGERAWSVNSDGSLSSDYVGSKLGVHPIIIVPLSQLGTN